MMIVLYAMAPRGQEESDDPDHDSGSALEVGDSAECVLGEVDYSSGVARFVEWPADCEVGDRVWCRSLHRDRPEEVSAEVAVACLRHLSARVLVTYRDDGRRVEVGMALTDSPRASGHVKEPSGVWAVCGTLRT